MINIKKYMFGIIGLISGLLISLSIKDLYNKITKIELGNIIDYNE